MKDHARTESKVHILFRFHDEPWGGGNQFLKALRDHMRTQGRYADDPASADVILFNSHHELDEVFRLKQRFPGKVFIHRVDGPIQVVRGSGREIDCTLFAFNRKIADGTVFQSQWSRERSREQGMPPNRFEAVIHNAPDPGVFFPATTADYASRSGLRRLRVVAASWSSNPMKGFDVYSRLDSDLDFSRFEMTFIGNSPIPFHNIRLVPPVPSARVAEELRGHDVFVSASRLEACSNAICEALNCGLVALVRDNSSQPELVSDRRFVFSGPEDVVSALERVAADFEALVASRKVETMDEIGMRYLEFADTVRRACGKGGGKRFAPLDRLGLRASSFGIRLEAKARRIWGRANLLVRGAR